MHKLILMFSCLLAASLVRAQTADEARCLASGGIEWDGTKSSPPRCQCTSGKVNAINAGGVCSREKPNCDKCVPAGTQGHVRVFYRERELPGKVVRESRPLLSSPAITIEPRFATAQPEGSIEVTVRVELEGLEEVSIHATSEGNHCLVRHADERFAEQVVFAAGPEFTVVVGSGREGECLIGVVARGKTVEYAEGLYTFRGAPLMEGAPPRRKNDARIGSPACQEFCSAWGDAARWNAGAPPGKQCEPQDAEHYFAAECTIFVKTQEPPPPDPDAACRTQCEGWGDLTRWVPDDPREVRCEPRDPERFLSGLCTIVPKAAKQQDPREVCGLVCEGFGGHLTERGCQCPEVLQTAGKCGCVPRPVVARPPVFHLGGELRTLGLIAGGDTDSLSVPVGVAPSLVLRFDPWGSGKDFLLGAGPLITGNGGQTDGRPVGVALTAGTYWSGWGSGRHRWSPFGLEVDFNWYAIDRTGEAYTFSLGGRAPVLRWQWRLRRGECHAGGGIGGAYVLPEEMAAFVWGLSAGCTTP